MNPLNIFLEPPGHIHTVSRAHSECLPTRLDPLAERTCFSQVPKSGPKQSSNVAQFVVQAFGVHNSEFEILWAEGTYDGPAARAPPSEQCLIIHRRLEKVNWGQNVKV